MMNRLSRLLIASHNEGKLREFAALLRPRGVAVVGAGELGLPEPEETGATFAENAILKARAAAAASGLPALADDSGLCVHALGGAPGVMSARWAGPERDFARAMARVLRELGDGPDRSAHFACVLALAWPEGRTRTFEGRVDGHLVSPPRGAGGFGYDPIFVPSGETRTYAEMSPAEKQGSSHRARATAALIAGVFADG
jgi:XTP/dITP diphosphohydrolase